MAVIWKPCLFSWTISICCTFHDDVIKRKHFPRSWLARCEGNLPVTGGFPSQRPALMFPLICARTNGWANRRDPGDLRRHCAHYDVTVKFCRGDSFYWHRWTEHGLRQNYLAAFCNDTIGIDTLKPEDRLAKFASLVTPKIFVTTTSAATCDDKVAILTTLGFHWYLQHGYMNHIVYQFMRIL